ncbi:MAG: HEXXH motif-containing putative peptide modification protein [Gammaproteobacteria bacterium]|nr:HEXXH motif-containing putative peptide modification protein [Gammaproteobacteria bacterium]
MSRKKLDSVPDKIRESLADLETVPWLPQLTTTIVENAREALYSRTGISVPDYGTARVLAGRPDTPRNITARLPICPNVESTSVLLIEALSSEDRCRYQDMGLAFCTSDETMFPAVCDCLREAVNLLRHEHSLQTTIAALVRVCHILKADDDYDVSHSDPQVPFSIFISVPRRRRPNDALRVIESIVHEAMHLQLTLIERKLPLVDRSASTHFSPWKGAYRSPQGVLHALYVFRVIDKYFERLQTHSTLSVADASYLSDRRETISKQIDEIRTFGECPALTNLGSEVVWSLLNSENPGPLN